MAETENLKLPLLQPAQAQKHVTVNEALVRLDGLTQLVIQSQSVVTPPVSATDGLAWAVPVGASDAWSGQEGQIALWENGGWVFIAPKIGWRGWIADESRQGLYDGTSWVSGGVSLSPNGAGATLGVAEIDHLVGSGASSTTADVIPAQTIVFGVTGRVIEEITGSLTSWDLGVAGSTNRYGSGFGLADNAWLRGITGSPLAYYSDTPLVLTASGGTFVGGTVRLSVHYMALELPSG